MIDMTGKQIGHWLVLERAENTSTGRAQWLCRCDLCGKEKIVTGINLRAGQSYSCGCQKMSKMRQASMKDETGKQYGYLKVLREATPEEKFFKTKKENAVGVYWVCKCLKCGNEHFIVKGDYLRNGDTKSCGCINSINEVKIEELLYRNNIKYTTQYSFNDLTSTGRACDKLLFDFAVLDNDNNLLYLIEYDGEQHFHLQHAWNKNSFDITKTNDKLKNEYCFTHGIPLIRIPYWAQNIYNINDLRLETTRFLITLNNVENYYKQINLL